MVPFSPAGELGVPAVFEGCSEFLFVFLAEIAEIVVAGNTGNPEYFAYFAGLEYFEWAVFPGFGEVLQASPQKC